MHDDRWEGSDHETEAILKAHPFPSPTPEMRDRILAHCRTEMNERAWRDRRRARVWRWSFAGGVATLLLLNAWVERRTEESVAQIIDPPASSVLALRHAPTPGESIRARNRMMAALLRDSSSL